MLDRSAAPYYDGEALSNGLSMSMVLQKKQEDKYPI